MLMDIYTFFIIQPEIFPQYGKRIICRPISPLNWVVILLIERDLKETCSLRNTFAIKFQSAQWRCHFFWHYWEARLRNSLNPMSCPFCISNSLIRNIKQINWTSMFAQICTTWKFFLRPYETFRDRYHRKRDRTKRDPREVQWWHVPLRSCHDVQRWRPR